MPTKGTPRPLNLAMILMPRLHQRIYDRVKEGSLPEDTFLRLGSSMQALNLAGDDSYPGVQKVYEALSDWDGINYDTLPTFLSNIMHGDLPPVLLDWGDIDSTRVLRKDNLYYCLNDMRAVVAARRRLRPVVGPEFPMGRHIISEWDIGLRSAHMLWRSLTREVMPQWLTEQGTRILYRPPVSSVRMINTDYETDYRKRLRGMTAATVISDRLMLSLLERAESTGIAKVGRVGKLDIRMLLTEQHPLLDPDHDSC